MSSVSMYLAEVVMFVSRIDDVVSMEFLGLFSSEELAMKAVEKKALHTAFAHETKGDFGNVTELVVDQVHIPGAACLTKCWYYHPLKGWWDNDFENGTIPE